MFYGNDCWLKHWLFWDNYTVLKGIYPFPHNQTNSGCLGLHLAKLETKYHRIIMLASMKAEIHFIPQIIITLYIKNTFSGEVCGSQQNLLRLFKFWPWNEMKHQLKHFPQKSISWEQLSATSWKDKDTMGLPMCQNICA